MSSPDTQSTADQLYEMLANIHSVQRTHTQAIDATEQTHAEDLLATEAEHKTAANSAQAERAKSEKAAGIRYESADKAAAEHGNNRKSTAANQVQAISNAVSRTNGSSLPNYQPEFELPSLEGKTFDQPPADALLSLKAQAVRLAKEVTKIEFEFAGLRDQRAQRMRRLSAGIGLLAAVAIIGGGILIGSIQTANSNNATATAQTANANATAAQAAIFDTMQAVDANATATQVAIFDTMQAVNTNATATQAAIFDTMQAVNTNATATQVAILNTTQVAIANATATQVAILNTTQVAVANATTTQVAIFNATQDAIANATATQMAVNGRQHVTANKQWTAQIQLFDGVPMALVPQGCFLMGSNPTQNAQANLDEQPPTKICFVHSFWIDEFPVWQAQFKKFNGKAANNSHFTGDKRPIAPIDWFEARTYCEQQRGGRLPTEAEYEYAARGPDDLIYPWGNTFVAANVVYSGNSDQTADIGPGIRAGGASWVGAVDLSGNVWEWTSSIYKPYPYIGSDGREDNSATNRLRALRGGSFADLSEYFLRAAYRVGFAPDLEIYYLGFRCARSN